MMNWRCEQLPDNGMIHVHPLADLHDHSIRGDGKCWCNPEVAYEDAGEMIIHKSLDGREEYEEGRLRLS